MARSEVVAEVTGKIWQIQASIGDQIREDDSIMVIESMKMEIPVLATISGRLVEILVKEGDAVESGQVVAVLER